MDRHVVKYYVNQAGNGAGHNFYVGAPHQKGYGIGGFLGGLFRSVVPYLKEGAQMAAKEAVRAGGHILMDTVSGETLSSSAKRHAAQARTNLINQVRQKMVGNGAIKRKRKASQSHFGSKRHAVDSPRVDPSEIDIFAENSDLPLAYQRGRFPY